MLAFASLQFAVSVPDEAAGRVVSVLSGDSFGIEITLSDSRTTSIDRVKLADVESPSTLTPEGKAAKEYTTSMLKNQTVYLDIDDNSTDGRNDLGMLVCVVYLMDPDNKPIWPCFNRILVDSGHAAVSDAKDNEFNSSSWWQEPPDMKATRSKDIVTDEKQENQASVLKVDPSTRQVSIGLSHYSTQVK